MSIRMAAAAALVLLSGCRHMYSVEQFGDRSAQVVCDGKAQCEAAWGRALIWVTEHCPNGIANQTDSLIVTYPTQRYSPTLECRVTRAKISKRKSRLLFAASCNNFLGCQPSPQSAHASFIRFVDEGIEEAREEEREEVTAAQMRKAQAEADAANADARAAQDDAEFTKAVERERAVEAADAQPAP